MIVGYLLSDSSYNGGQVGFDEAKVELADIAKYFQIEIVAMKVWEAHDVGVSLHLFGFEGSHERIAEFGGCLLKAFGPNAKGGSGTTKPNIELLKPGEFTFDVISSQDFSEVVTNIAELKPATQH